MASDHRSGTHRIRKAIFELRFPNEKAAFRGRMQLAEQFEQVFVPLLADICDAYAPNGQTVPIDRLEIDLGSIDPERLHEASLRQAIQAALDRSWPLLAASGAPSPELDLARTWAAFLEHGRWPWYSPFTRVAELEAELLALEPAEARRVVHHVLPLLQRRDVRLRAAYQFSFPLLRWVMEQIQPGRTEAILHTAHLILGDLDSGKARATVLAAAVVLAPVVGGERRSRAFSMPLVEAMEDVVRQEARRLDWPTLDDGSASPPQAARWRDAQRQTQEPPMQSNTATGVQVEQTADDKEGLYVPHAGVVLLHPFLERFFRRAGLLPEAPDPDASWRTRAIHLLYHLATGREQPEEHETPLLKLLCGWTLDDPIERQLSLSQQEREEAASLLGAVINHWDRLRNTSPDGLREAFLQRDGRLAPVESGWHLTVEQSGVDVLLSSLPWGLSVVRLPWMVAPVWVDWA